MAVDILGTGEHVRRTATALSTIQEKYLIMRRAALLDTHQAALAEFADTVGSQFNTINDVANAYFQRWRMSFDRSQAEHKKQVTAIQNDRNMDALRKIQAVERLRQPMYPAWSQEKEDAFIQTYGDPRADMNAWNAQLAEFQRAEVVTMGGEQQVVYQRTAWELYTMRILETPEIDGSVAPCVEITPQAAQGVQFIDVALRTREAFTVPAPADGQPPISREYYERMEKAARSVCPHCLQLFPQGFKNHEIACANKHGEPSIYGPDAVAGGSMRANGGSGGDGDDDEDEGGAGGATEAERQPVTA